MNREKKWNEKFNNNAFASYDEASIENHKIKINFREKMQLKCWTVSVQVNYFGVLIVNYGLRKRFAFQLCVLDEQEHGFVCVRVWLWFNLVLIATAVA